MPATSLGGKGTLDARKVLEYEVPGEQENTIFDLNGRQLSEKPASGYYIRGQEISATVKKRYTRFKTNQLCFPVRSVSSAADLSI